MKNECLHLNIIIEDIWLHPDAQTFFCRECQSYFGINSSGVFVRWSEMTRAERAYWDEITDKELLVDE